jgi:hypothetical protein
MQIGRLTGSFESDFAGNWLALNSTLPARYEFRGRNGGFRHKQRHRIRCEGEGVPQVADFMVELSGIEPLASSLRKRLGTNLQ